MGILVGKGEWYMIKVVMELELVHPYKISIDVLVEFCSLWETRILSGGTQKRIALIEMPAHHFKVIFGTNPREKKYAVPRGAESFIEALKVKDIIIE
jgi:hypothetical protein